MKEETRNWDMGRAALFLAGMLVVVGCIAACGGTDESGVPGEVTLAVERFTEAINTYDTEALLSVTTEDFTWESTGEVQTRSEFVDHFEAYYQAGGFRTQPSGTLTVERDGDGYLAQEPGRVTSTGYNEDGRSVYRLVEVDGSWLIQSFRWYEAQE